MVYLALIAALVVGGMCYLFALSRRSVLAQIHNSIRIFNISVAMYLARKYAAKHGEDLGIRLASAVTNRLFLEHPSNDDGEVFLREYGGLVEGELLALRTDGKIRYAVSEAVRMKANVAANRRQLTGEILGGFAKLKEMGFLSEEWNEPASNEEFARRAREFEQSVMGDS